MRLSNLDLEVYVSAIFPGISQSILTMTFQNDHDKVSVDVFTILKSE